MNSCFRNVVKINRDVKQKIMLADKSSLTAVLANKTKPGDIILFANDAPNFI